MFFEEEKDFIENGADIHIDEDGTVTWEEVLNNDNDDNIVSKAVKTTPQSQTVDLGDELELVQEEENEEEQLGQILNEESSAENTNMQQASEEEFDIDSQLANVVLEENKQNNNTGTIKPRKIETKKQTSLLPVLISALFAVLVVGGIYYAKEYMNSQNVSNDNLAIPATKQDEMNNITQEEIAQRTKEENIPVVNEEDANTIKPDEQIEEEKPKEEKKEVIDVKQTGRPNPFMPIAKYVKVSIPQTSIDYDHSGVPKPPEAYGTKDEVATKLMTIAVSGIMYDDAKPSAIITYDDNDYFVQEGDKLDEYKVLDIARNYVTIALGKNVYKANIGEEFKISSKFYGSAQYLSPKQGGGRQYYSVKENADSEASFRTDGLRYVSEDEVEVRAK